MSARRWRRAPVRAVIALIECYRQLISPMRLPTCRFTPTCSQYAVEALTAHGLVRGGALAGWRLLRCGPWHPGGFDPVAGTAESDHDVSTGPVHRAEGEPVVL
ncbi:MULTISPECIES: membrane protein insertion efficiency factor YidD [Mycobacteriaceae]|uniref:Putative membrane protein insertion efficiency factor n=1 Tax=Mycolicibacillus parakoreensis TaxID=1069221 RepID=A0ABY3U5P2_9MYCO|nr:MULTISPECIES: membrane protein insertion efficiency factor YidD [Mycobacteriaceae]ULN52827.1 membrane protein insertion efficiency factor YidD [Mycolicibacillus parakoreensis]